MTWKLIVDVALPFLGLMSMFGLWMTPNNFSNRADCNMTFYWEFNNTQLQKSLTPCTHDMRIYDDVIRACEIIDSDKYLWVVSVFVLLGVWRSADKYIEKKKKSLEYPTWGKPTKFIVFLCGAYIPLILLAIVNFVKSKIIKK